jgi:lipopolysaccharide export system protein LptA
MHAVRLPKPTLVLAIIGILAMPPATAQPSSGPPNALQGFSQNRDKPVQIDAATLEVRDKDKMATFLGNVRVVQGDTTMRCKTLVVFYDQDTPAGPASANLTAAKPGPGGSQQIKRLEAKGNVIVTQKDQTATGETGIFDMKSNTVTLLGGVVMTQSQNVLRGERLVVDLTTGVSRVESKTGQSRVQGLFLPAGGPETKPGGSAATGASPAGHEAPKSRPPGPSGLY